MMDFAGGAAEASFPPTPNRSAVVTTCQKMAGSGGGVAAYQAAYAPLIPGQCLNIAWAWECPTSKGTEEEDDKPDPQYWGYCGEHYATSPTC